MKTILQLTGCGGFTCFQFSRLRSILFGDFLGWNAFCIYKGVTSHCVETLSPKIAITTFTVNIGSFSLSLGSKQVR